MSARPQDRCSEPPEEAEIGMINGESTHIANRERSDLSLHRIEAARQSATCLTDSEGCIPDEATLCCRHSVQAFTRLLADNFFMGSISPPKAGRGCQIRFTPSRTLKLRLVTLPDKFRAKLCILKSWRKAIQRSIDSGLAIEVLTKS